MRTSIILVALAASLGVGCSDNTLHVQDDEKGPGPAGEPRARVSPSSVDFGFVATSGGSENTREVEEIVLIGNEGTATLLLLDVSLDEGAPEYRVGSVSLPSVPVDGELELKVFFNPTAPGLVEDVLVITTNEPRRDVWEIPLAGEGVAR